MFCGIASAPHARWIRQSAGRPLRSHLRTLVKSIADKDVRNAYGGELAKRLDAEFAPPPRAGGQNPWRGDRPRAPRQRGQGFRYQEPARPSPRLKRAGGPAPWRREASLVLSVINHPLLMERAEQAFFDLDLADPGLKTLLGEVLSAISADPGLDREGLKSHLTASGAADSLERVLNDPELSKHRFLRPETEIDEVEQGFRNALAHHLYESTLKQEVARSASQIFTNGDEEWKAAAAAREELVNENRAGETDMRVEEGGADRLQSALDRMKENVAKKFGR